MSLASLKKSNSLEKLTKALESTTGNGTLKKEDDRFWVPEVDKTGNGYAVVRFLDTPEVDGEDGLPWVQVWSHGFQGPGGWYIENSLTTVGQKDPVSEYNTKLWNSGIEANKEIARKQKRKLTYYANVLVVSDPKRPENEGKVFLYKFGKKVFEKINAKLSPEFQDEKPMNPFDFWKGANFKLKIRNYEGYRNYDKSEFDSPSELFDGDDAKIEKAWKSAHSLKEFIDPKNFKSYDELKAKLDRVLGAGGVAGAVATKVEAKKSKEDDLPPWNASEQTTAEQISVETDRFLETDDDLDYFDKLAKDI